MFENDSANINHPVQLPGTTLLTGGSDDALVNAYTDELGELFISETTEQIYLSES